MRNGSYILKKERRETLRRSRKAINFDCNCNVIRLILSKVLSRSQYGAWKYRYYKGDHY